MKPLLSKLPMLPNFSARQVSPFVTEKRKALVKAPESRPKKGREVREGSSGILAKKDNGMRRRGATLREPQELRGRHYVKLRLRCKKGPKVDRNLRKQARSSQDFAKSSIVFCMNDEDVESYFEITSHPVSHNQPEVAALGRLQLRRRSTVQERFRTQSIRLH